MIPVFAAAGHRVIAPDPIGFGRSDKPVDEAVYTFDFHRQILLELVERLALTNVRLVCQDWGGILSLTLPMAASDRYKGLLVMNTALGTGDLPLGDGFIAWRTYARSQPDLDITKLMKRSVPTLSADQAAAYAAPFPDARNKAGVRCFSELVPDHPDAGGAAISHDARTCWREHWFGKRLMAAGMEDLVRGPPSMRYLHKQICVCSPPIELADAGHFVHEWGGTTAGAAWINLA